MKMTRRRYWVFFLLFLFNLIAYVDRVNMSVAGEPIAQEFGLSPVALGYLFSSFLWAYVLMMLPGGRLIDGIGAHRVAAIMATIWSIAQILSGASIGFVSMLLTRLGLGAAKRLFLAAEKIDAAELLRIGFLDAVVPASELAGHVDALAARLASHAPAAVQGMKRALNNIAAGTADAAEITRAWRASMRSADVAEGVAALAEKRKPKFRDA